MPGIFKYCRTCFRKITKKGRKNDSDSVWVPLQKYATWKEQTTGVETVYVKGDGYVCGDCYLAMKNNEFHRIIPVKSLKRPSSVIENDSIDIDLQSQPDNDISSLHNESMEYSTQSSLSTVSDSYSSAFSVDSQASTVSFESQASIDSAGFSGYSSYPTSSVNSANIFNSAVNIVVEECGSSTSVSSISEPTRFKIPRMKQAIQIDIPACASTMSKCFICGNKSKQGRLRIPKRAIASIWFHKKVFIPVNNRCCTIHLSENGYFNNDAEKKIIASQTSTLLTGNEIKVLLSSFNDKVFSTVNTVTFDENSQYTTYDYELLTGLTKKNFDHAFGLISSELRNSCNRTKRNALGLFLMKLKTNLSQEVLSILFNMNCQQHVSDTFESVRVALEKHFVPLYLGYQHITRQQAKVHQSTFAHTLFGADEDSLCLIADGTYLFIKQLSDHDEQKKTFSNHKHGNLVKPMMVIHPKGYIQNADGLYFANNGNNDSNILKAMLLDVNGISSFLRPNDFILLDRGFRDVIPELTEKGYKTYSPSCLQKKQPQFTTLQANETRKVTMLRWTVEAKNGHAKRFKFLKEKIEATYLPKLSSIFKIICGLLNAYSPPLFQDDEEHLQMANNAVLRTQQENILQHRVETLKLESRRKNLIPATKDSLLNFPVLTEKDLKCITLGTYQRHNAPLYTRRHMKKDSNYSFWTFSEPELSDMLRANMESRFGQGTHQLWITFDSSKEGGDSITGWYCRCKNGARTIGCCSHVISVIWYLGFARHQELDLVSNKRRLAENILDAAEILQKHLEESQEDATVG